MTAGTFRSRQRRSGAEPKLLGDFELNMSGIEEFDLIATPNHEYYGPSIGSVLTPVAPPFL